MNEHVYDTFDLKLFGRRLNRRREQLGWTKAELAEKIGTARSHIANMCRGGGSAPSMDLFVTICKTMHVSADYLLGFSHTSCEKNDDKFEEEVDRRYEIAEETYKEIGLAVPDNLKDLIAEQVLNEMETEDNEYV